MRYAVKETKKYKCGYIIYTFVYNDGTIEVLKLRKDQGDKLASYCCYGM